MFSIYDSKMEAYGTPFFMPKQQMAIRAFSDIARDEKTNVNKHREDFTLFEIGEYDDSNAVVVSCTPPINLGHAVIPEVQPEIIDLGKMMNGQKKLVEGPKEA